MAPGRSRSTVFTREPDRSPQFGVVSIRDTGTRRAYARRTAVTTVALFVALAWVPLASAHGEAAHSGPLTQGHGIAVLLVGMGVLAGAVALKRTGRITPTTALYGAFAGLVLATVGAMVFDGLAPDPSYGANTMPIPRSWYPPLALGTGLLVALGSFVVGWLKWPTRPRYTFLGILLGVWLAYPSLIPGAASMTHPIGYAIVLATPVLVGYIVRVDAWRAIRVACSDAVSRLFGIGVGLVLAVYFNALSGYLTVFPAESAPEETVVAVETVLYQLVMWPTLEVFLPSVPVYLAVSPGSIALVGTMSVLVGLNAALVAYQWRLGGVAAGGTTEGTVGTGAVVGSCACGCCGPIVAQIAVLAAGPSIAAPLYWILVDSQSPFALLLLLASIALFTGGLVYATRTTALSTPAVGATSGVEDA